MIKIITVITTFKSEGSLIIMLGSKLSGNGDIDTDDDNDDNDDVGSDAHEEVPPHQASTPGHTSYSIKQVCAGLILRSVLTSAHS